MFDQQNACLTGNHQSSSSALWTRERTVCVLKVVDSREGPFPMVSVNFP
jgi:hypothetical protein